MSRLPDAVWNTTSVRARRRRAVRLRAAGPGVVVPGMPVVLRWMVIVASFAGPRRPALEPTMTTTPDVALTRRRRRHVSARTADDPPTVDRRPPAGRRPG
jgi:hypothetical protein